MTLESLLSVGVIEVKARRRPHQVARDIDRLKKDDVFVRHGSVVMKASPDEIIQMNGGDIRQQREIRNLIRAAETHKEIGNFELALAAYTRAIEIAPTAEHFLSRGELRLHHFKTIYMNRSQMEELGKVAYKDFEDAFVLAENVNQEKRARFGRAEITANDVAALRYSADDWEEDVAWLRKNTKGYELGKALYLEVLMGHNNVGIDEDDRWLAEVNDAITLGYTEPHIFHLRAFAHFYRCNYGLALKDLDKALETPLQWADPWVESLCLKATVLAYVKRYDEAYSVFLEAKNRAGSDFPDSLGYLEHELDNDILCRCGLVRLFAGASYIDFATLLIKSLRHKLDDRGYGSIQNHYPRLAAALRRIDLD